MPLTRRVQVFISQEASDKLDVLTKETGLGVTALLEQLILNAPTPEPPPVSFAESTYTFDKAVKDALPQPESKAGQVARRLGKAIGPSRPLVREYNGPVSHSEIPVVLNSVKPLERPRPAFPKPNKGKKK